MSEHECGHHPSVQLGQIVNCLNQQPAGNVMVHFMSPHAKDVVPVGNHLLEAHLSDNLHDVAHFLKMYNNPAQLCGALAGEEHPMGAFLRAHLEEPPKQKFLYLRLVNHDHDERLSGNHDVNLSVFHDRAPGSCFVTGNSKGHVSIMQMPVRSDEHAGKIIHGLATKSFLAPIFKLVGGTTQQALKKALRVGVKRDREDNPVQLRILTTGDGSGTAVHNLRVGSEQLPTLIQHIAKALQGAREQAAPSTVDAATQTPIVQQLPPSVVGFLQMLQQHGAQPATLHSTAMPLVHFGPSGPTAAQSTPGPADSPSMPFHVVRLRLIPAGSAADAQMVQQNQAAGVHDLEVPGIQHLRALGARPLSLSDVFRAMKMHNDKASEQAQQQQPVCQVHGTMTRVQPPTMIPLCPNVNSAPQAAPGSLKDALTGLLGGLKSHPDVDVYTMTNGKLRKVNMNGEGAAAALTNPIGGIFPPSAPTDGMAGMQDPLQALQQSMTGGQPSMMGGQMSMMGGQQLETGDQQPTMGGQMSMMGGQQPPMDARNLAQMFSGLNVGTESDAEAPVQNEGPMPPGAIDVQNGGAQSMPFQGMPMAGPIQGQQGIVAPQQMQTQEQPQMPQKLQDPSMPGMQMNGMPGMQMNGMPGMQMNGMPMQMSGMPMQMGGMPMPGVQGQPSMQMSGMPMSGIQMQGQPPQMQGQPLMQMSGMTPQQMMTIFPSMIPAGMGN